MHRGVGIGCYSFCIIVAGSSMTYGLGLILDNYTSDAAIKVRRHVNPSPPFPALPSRFYVPSFLAGYLFGHTVYASFILLGPRRIDRNKKKCGKAEYYDNIGIPYTFFWLIYFWE